MSLKKQIMAVGYSGYPEHMEHEEIKKEDDHESYS